MSMTHLIAGLAVVLVGIGLASVVVRFSEFFIGMLRLFLRPLHFLFYPTMLRIEGLLLGLFCLTHMAWVQYGAPWDTALVMLGTVLVPLVVCFHKYTNPNLVTTVILATVTYATFVTQNPILVYINVLALMAWLRGTNVTWAVYRTLSNSSNAGMAEVAWMLTPVLLGL